MKGRGEKNLPNNPPNRVQEALDRATLILRRAFLHVDLVRRVKEASWLALSREFEVKTSH